MFAYNSIYTYIYISDGFLSLSLFLFVHNIYFTSRIIFLSLSLSLRSVRVFFFIAVLIVLGVVQRLFSFFSLSLSLLLFFSTRLSVFFFFSLDHPRSHLH